MAAAAEDGDATVADHAVVRVADPVSVAGLAEAAVTSGLRY